VTSGLLTPATDSAMSTAEYLRNSSVLSASDAPNIHELEQEATDELARLNQQLFQLQKEMVEVPRAQLGDKMAHMAALEVQILSQRLKQREATVKRLQADLFAKQEMSLEDRTPEQREVLKQEVSEIRRRILRTKTRIRKDIQNSPPGTAEEMHCGMRTPNLDPSEPGSIATCFTALEEEESDDGGPMQLPAEDSHDERFFAVDDDDDSEVSEVSQLRRSLRDERRRADRLQIERDEAVNDCKKLQKELKSRRPRRGSSSGNGPTETQQLHDEISRLQKQVDNLSDVNLRNQGCISHSQ